MNGTMKSVGKVYLTLIAIYLITLICACCNALLAALVFIIGFVMINSKRKQKVKHAHFWGS